MSEIQSPKLKIQSPNSETEQTLSDDLFFVEGELVENAADERNETETTAIGINVEKQISVPKIKNRKPEINNQKSFLHYIVLPLIFLTTALLGGLRVGVEEAEILFLKPPLVCLIFAAVLLVLFSRVHLIKLDGWFSESFSPLKNIANACVLLTLFFASTQIFNSLLPEKSLPFWIVSFCFFWTLWNNLFAAFDAKKLIQSLGGMFGLAFVVKYLLLANLTAPASRSWIQGILENPTQEALTWLLDLPKFAAVTGYIQFFAVVFYLIGLFLLKPETNKS